MKGSPQWESQLYFERCPRKNLNCGNYTDDKHIIVFVKQISDKLQSIRAQNHMIAYMRHPITAP